MKSSQPRKQRKKIYNASLHERNKFASGHLSKALIKQYNRRSLPLKKGDEIKIMVGKHRGITGKISEIDLGSSRIYLDNLKRRKVSGQEVKIGIHSSNIMITNPNVDDKERQKIIKRSKENE